ncbi:hypothetical protein HK096_001350, partial [Nowakowskiella sp. JEL0078]
METAFQIFKEYSPSSLNLIKLHSITNYVKNVREFGLETGTTTNLGEFCGNLL